MKFALALLAALTTPSALAWSTDVHNQIGVRLPSLPALFPAVNPD